MKWQWPERSGRPSRKECFKGASHLPTADCLDQFLGFHFTAWTDQVCNSSVWSTGVASIHSNGFQQYRIWAECESNIAQDILNRFHRCLVLKKTTSCSKWTTPRKAERRIRCRMQSFCPRGTLSVNWRATVACLKALSATQCLLHEIDAWVRVVKMPNWELVDNPSVWIWAVTSDTSCFGLRSHCATKRAIMVVP